MCSMRGVARQADDRAAGVRIPVGRAEADERRHEVDAAGIGHVAHQALDIGRRADRPQTVAQPLHGRAGHEHRAFERVGRLVAEPPRHRRQQALLRRHRPRPGVEQHEAAGAVGVLGLAGLEAGLAEERRLLIAGGAGNRDRRRRSSSGVRLAVDLAAAAHLRQHLRAARRRAPADRRPSGAGGCCRAACGWRCSRRSRARVPPVRRQMRKLSMVPKSTSPRAARARRPSVVSSRCLIFEAEK